MGKSPIPSPVYLNRTRHQNGTLEELPSPSEMRIVEEVLTSSSLLSADDSPASRTRSRVSADYMAATHATETTPEHIERVNQNRTHMASARQQSCKTLTIAALYWLATNFIHMFIHVAYSHHTILQCHHIDFLLISEHYPECPCSLVV